jgi:hypothetical protein
MPGPGALARGRLALEIVRERLKLTNVAASELRFELVGVDSLHGPEVSARAGEPYEVRVRVSGRTENLREAVRIGNEVETLYTNGPAAAAVRGNRRATWWRSLPCCCRANWQSRKSGSWGREDEAARDRPFPHRRQGQYLQHLRHCL